MSSWMRWGVEVIPVVKLDVYKRQLLSSIPLALPGMVIGLSFIFFFNSPDNPLNFIYGTVAILVLANVVHFYSVPFVTASSALKKHDKD